MEVQIPAPQLHLEVAKNQHLVSQCYMREWSYNGRDSVWIYDKATRFNADHPEQSDWGITSKKTSKINSIDYFYDTKAGDFYMPDEALNELFGFLQPFSISLNGASLDTLEKLNMNYSEFANWEIYYDGNEVAPSDRQKIQEYLDKSRYSYIETAWSHKYENTWRQDISNLEQKLRTLKATSPSGVSATTLVTADDLKKIIEYMVIFDWRCLGGAWAMDNVLDTFAGIVPEIMNAPIPMSSGAVTLHKEDITIKDQFRHQLLLKYFDSLLRNNDGPLREVIDITVKNLSVRFCLADASHPFITSDKPVYLYTRSDTFQEYVFVARPTMLISLGRGNKSEFIVHNLSCSEVDAYNKAMANQGLTLILPSNTFPISSLLMP